MAKKSRRKAAKKSKAATKKKGVATKKKRKIAVRKKSSPAVRKKLVAKKKPAGKKATTPSPPESISRKVAGAFNAVVDVFTDAERLHQKLDPDISREPE
jgi:hypothetical protein